MPKREPEPEPIDEEASPAELPTVGERLRAAREEKGVSLEDVAAQTRIPLRHLASIETANWDNLPAPTYTVGFAKSYAAAVGLDRNEIGDQLREEMGGQRFASTSADVFEPADPRRTMPKSIVFGAIIGVVVLIVLFSWLNKRSLEPSGAETNVQTAAATAPSPSPPPPSPRPVPTAGQPVVLTATSPVWLQVSERDGGASLFSGTLQAGQTYAVPATATAPVLKTGKPEALKITVGNAVAPPVGPMATTVSNVSLLGPDLMKVPAATPAASVVHSPAAHPGPRRSASVDTTPAPAPGPAETAPTTNTGQ
jgi:transcriptional regulator with XRE-family HTH domain